MSLTIFVRPLLCRSPSRRWPPRRSPRTRPRRHEQRRVRRQHDRLAHEHLLLNDADRVRLCGDGGDAQGPVNESGTRNETSCLRGRSEHAGPEHCGFVPAPLERIKIASRRVPAVLTPPGAITDIDMRYSGSSASRICRCGLPKRACAGSAQEDHLPARDRRMPSSAANTATRARRGVSRGACRAGLARSSEPKVTAGPARAAHAERGDAVESGLMKISRESGARR